VALQQFDDVAPEKCAVHAEFRTVALQGRRELLEERPQKSTGGLAVVDVPRPVLHAQHLPALRLIRGDRVIAGHFAMVRIVAALRPLHLLAGGYHRAVDVDGESRESGTPDRCRGELRIQFLHPRQVMRAELAQPPPDAARGREPCQAAEALHQRIALQVEQMAHPAATADYQRQQQQDHRGAAEVGPRQVSGELPTQLVHQADGAQVASQKLQPGIRGQAGRRESQLQVRVDAPPQIRSS
jgi:hypothetical protein